MNIDSFVRDSQTTSIGILAQLALGNTSDADSLFRMFVEEKVEDNFTINQCINALLKNTQDLALYAANSDPEFFTKLAVYYAGKDAPNAGNED